jgi:hypothetical protein
MHEVMAGGFLRLPELILEEAGRDGSGSGAA